MTHKVQDLNRRNLSFSKSRVRELLPEYFAESYPNIITFLEKYYEYLEDENIDSFKTEVNQIFVARDPYQVDLDKLDYILQEIGNGLKTASFFDNPRIMTGLLSRFYRVKGSLNSIEGFFRGFFGQEVTVEYPKNKMFIVGQSEIGYESLKFIQNNALYQIFSILIKSPLSTTDYNDLYLKFVHPAGFYYAGQVEIEGVKAFGITVDSGGSGIRPAAEGGLILASEAPFTTFPITNTAFDVDKAFATQAVEGDSFFTISDFTQLTGLIDSASVTYRMRLDDPISNYQALTPTQLETYYSSLSEIISPNSFTFDDSDRQDSALTSAPDFAMTIETMDNDMFTVLNDSIGDSFY